MAKNIRECLLEQAGKFHQWQEITYPGKTTKENGSMWEVDYPYWNDAYRDLYRKPLPRPNGLSASAAEPPPPMRVRPSGSLPPICRNIPAVRKPKI